MTTKLKENVTTVVTTGGIPEQDTWYTIKCKQYMCISCGLLWVYIHQGDRIIVWPEKDDPELLKLAQHMKEDGRNPKIIEYQKSMGPCISWYRVQS